jgi:glucose/arabinose dehydrogenase
MRLGIPILVLAFVLVVVGVSAGQAARLPAAAAAARTGPAAAPRVLEADGQRFRVVPITGLVRPWALAVLPNLDVLVTEREGRLRIIRNGVLDPEPIAGLPEVNTGAVNSGLMDVVLHPRYEENRLIYFTYSKPMPGNPHDDFQGGPGGPPVQRDAATATLARARFDGGNALADVTDVFVSDAWSQGTSGARIAFSRDGKIIMTVGMPTRHMIGTADDAQNPANHAGKVLRLNADGSAPHDNPFAGREGYRPEIYALGIRNALGLFVHPDTGQIWETENGPMGGDELNIIEAGRNYGWPVVSYGRDYTGNKLGGLSGTTSEHPWAPGMEEPFAFWNPSPALAGITFYTGDRFPTWTGNAFIAAMGRGSLGTRQLHRIVFNRQGRVQRNGGRTLLAELEQRIRDVRQGPDGLLYLTTDEPAGAVLRIEPVESSP